MGANPWTPGPWRVASASAAADLDAPWRAEEVLLGADHRALAYVGFNGDAHAEPNVRLIAKAPEMFDTIVELLDELSLPESGALTRNETGRRRVARARQILTEARGG